MCVCIARAAFQLPAQNFLKGGDIFGKFMYLSGCCKKRKTDRESEREREEGKGKVSGQNNSKVFCRNIVFWPCVCVCVYAGEQVCSTRCYCCCRCAYDLLHAHGLLPAAAAAPSLLLLLLLLPVAIAGHFVATKRKFVYFVKSATGVFASPA